MTASANSWSPRALNLAWVALLGAQLSAQTGGPDYQNPDLPLERRVHDLVSRMTLEERVSQMQDVAPAIERLGIPAYNWWNEALHGVARSGLATSFPQAIGLAATWDDSLIFQMATVISDEARAKHHDYIRQGSRERYQGLTFWSPNINLFRDPRWGRGQETYGEDPFLTGRLATQFVRGMQGDDPKYLKTVSTVKHFAVHSGPEPERHTFDAVVSERDLRERRLAQGHPARRMGLLGLRRVGLRRHQRHLRAPQGRPDRGGRRGPRRENGDRPRVWQCLREPRRRRATGTDHRAGDRHRRQAAVPRPHAARRVRSAGARALGADPDQRARPAGAPRARPPGGARVHRVAQECRQRVAAPQRHRHDRRHRAELRRPAHAARQRRGSAGRFHHTASRHPRGRVARHARALRPRLGLGCARRLGASRGGAGGGA